MAISQGPCDHPSYLVRQQLFIGKTTAGANGTQTNLMTAFSNNTRIRNVSAVVVVAGTSATTGHQAIIGCVGTCTQFGTTGVGTVGTATTTLGTIVLGTGAANATGTSGDLNVCLNAGAVLYVKNGTDATGTYNVTVESHVDPLGTWIISAGG